jgi:streptothricin hydrolase
VNCALILVDVQLDMLEPPNPVPSHTEVKRELTGLLEKARKAGTLVVHIQNDGPKGESDEPNTKGWELVFPPLPGEHVFRKTAGDAFSNGKLIAALEARKIQRVIVGGMLSNYCVVDTCRGALRNGYAVVLASGAHAAYDEKESASEISSSVERDLRRNGASVIPSKKITFV